MGRADLRAGPWVLKRERCSSREKFICCLQMSFLQGAGPPIAFYCDKGKVLERSFLQM